MIKVNNKVNSFHQTTIFPEPLRGEISTAHHSEFYTVSDQRGFDEFKLAFVI